ncbi:hypothetical protein [Variovorax sp. OV329]|uniref:hypothetical protein n=1 Tax=Variovorax sp. OV329 TaxID=1882825 RepID=UPI0008E3D9A1|nr:hypothetical protein [Variovorax sp. OV329]SFN18836.1 hypothetical protein SAMN05444747_11773 [Variovorax sp. OV329]
MAGQLVAQLKALWTHHFCKLPFYAVAGPHREIYLDPASVPDFYKADIASFSFRTVAMTRADFDRLPAHLRA